MKHFAIILSLITIMTFVSIGLASRIQETKKPDPAQDTTAVNSEDPFAPIDNMHHFMEYISQPSYKALKASFAGAAPENRKAWKPIKSHALILAETSALVAQRIPQDATAEQSSQWGEYSLAVYESGKELYKSAGDFEEAKKHYSAMIQNCNKCHQVFDNGKHQLQP